METTVMRLESIVVGMDFSDAAITGAAWAAEHFAPAAAMSLVHVIPPLEEPAYAGHLMPSSQEFEAVAREYSEHRMDDIATSLNANVVRRDVRVGKPDREIVRLASEIGTDLILIGPHGDRPRPRRFLGTTADRIVRTSSVPVLVATRPPVGRPRNILVPVDDSSIMPVLLAWARDLAAEFDADVKLLHVWSNAVYSDAASMSYARIKNEDDARRDIAQGFQDAATQWLERLARTGMTGSRATATVTYGNAGDVVLETAVAMSADLIVLGRRGTGLVAPALLGSTVGTVLHGADCPVLVLVEPATPGDGRG
jgi:nucleotide-binding universal stress UspA family protein